MTTCKGIAKGRTIELEQPLPYSEGQLLHITVKPLEGPRAQDTSPRESWLEFLNKTYGSCADLGLERPDQGQYEHREGIE